ncbi:hypothetical protein CAPTEDRAFT_192207 [Capitella teleta]|uniref:Uncharacterized protein n=1 Tax=Capitella teleta TaxID=283909 RepID=R7TMQ7_CAPTE|nr:hypothetical protein CAPTEDRAFT_192207 [Capitella teleta]|eukprot:ELT94929.1 hypothetical protein CAPTEDRAFT_192207 [Capitella teleta]
MPSMKEEFSRFLETTSMKGLPRMIKAEGFFLRALWLVGFLALLCFAFWLAFQQIISFFKYGVVTVVHEENLLNMEHSVNTLNLAAFFAITVCNLKPLPSSFLRMNSTIMSYDAHVQKVEQMGANILQTMPAGQVEGLEHLLAYLKSYAGYYAQFKVQDLPKLGYRVEDMFVDCYYTVLSNGGEEEIPCQEVATFRILSVPEYFNCYTLEINDTYMIENEKQPFSLTGIMHLDNMDLIIPETWKASSNLQESGGLLYVGLPSRMPSLKFANYLSPGFQTHVRINFDIRQRLPPPHGTCQHNSGNSYQDMLGQPFVYTVGGCLRLCMQNQTLKTCGCVSPQLIVMPLMEKGSWHMCGDMNQDVADLIMEITCAAEMASQSREGCYLTCLPECSEMRDHSIISQSQWPQVKSHLPLYKDVIAHQPYGSQYHAYAKILEDYNLTKDVGATMNEVSKLKLIENNFLKFTVLTSGSSVNSVTDEPSMTVFTLMSQLGGILNLYTGITALLLIESIELLYNILSNAMSTKSKTTVTKVRPFNETQTRGENFK